MNVGKTTEQFSEDFTCLVFGKDIPDCRNKAWFSLFDAMGDGELKDDSNFWRIAEMHHQENMDKVVKDGKIVEDENTKYMCAAKFVRIKDE